MLLVAMAAKTFCTRPSDLMAVADPVLALAFDMASFRKLLDLEKGESKGDPERICL